MKRILALWVMGFLMASSVSVANAAGNIDWSANAGVAVPLTSGFDLGFGGEAAAGFNIGPNLDLTGTLGFYTFNVTGSSSTASASASSLEVLAGLKYMLGSSDSSVKPYIFGQAGFSDYSASINVSLGSYGSVSASGSEVDPEIAGGAGLSFGLGSGSNVAINLQTKVGVVLAGSSFTYLPIVAGVSF